MVQPRWRKTETWLKVKVEVNENGPIPITVKLFQFNDQEMVRKKGRLKGTNYGISPKSHAILAKRKKVTSIVLEKRKEGKAIFMVWDKLYEDGVLWGKNEIAGGGGGGVAMLSQ